jgi:hypothetical protein
MAFSWICYEGQQICLLFQINRILRDFKLVGILLTIPVSTAKSEYHLVQSAELRCTFRAPWYKGKLNALAVLSCYRDVIIKISQYKQSVLKLQ